MTFNPPRHPDDHSPEPMSEEEARERIAKTWAELDVWRRTPGPLQPVSGSQLMADDSDWPPMRLSTLARFALDAAADHLQAVRIHIENNDIHPIADLTLLRTALIGGAQAVWLLAPDDPAERRERARTLAMEAYEEHAKYLAVLLRLDPEHPGTIEVRDRVGVRAAELKALRDSDGQAARYQNTSTIKEAVLAAFKDCPADQRAELENEAEVLWRSGSAAAHRLAHSILGQPGSTVSAPDNQGMAVHYVRGSAARMVSPWLAAFYLTRRGWKLMRRRGM